MKKLGILSAILFFQISVVGVATAQNESKPGLYLQGAFATQITTGNQKQSIEDNGGDTNFYGGSVAVGYFLADWLAVQARIQFLSGPGTGDIDTAGVDITMYNVLYTGAVKLYPLALLTQSADGPIQPYAIFGVGGQTFSISDSYFSIDPGDRYYPTSNTNFLLEAGAGIDVMFSQNFGLFGEATYEYIDWEGFNLVGNKVSAVGVNVGITYRF